MVTVEVMRRYSAEGYTIGTLFVNGERLCDTLEDTDRHLDDAMGVTEIAKKKIYGKTAIPTGRYPMRLAWSPKFKRLLPRLECVKGYSGILIHAGNTAGDTLGCILVGENRVKGKVLNSRHWEDRLVAMLQGFGDDDMEVVVRWN